MVLKLSVAATGAKAPHGSARWNAIYVDGLPATSLPPSLADALEKQLGLKPEVRKHPVQLLVIDHMEEKPIEN